jgi:hypothetical protein
MNKERIESRGDQLRLLETPNIDVINKLMAILQPVTDVFVTSVQWKLIFNDQNRIQLLLKPSEGYSLREDILCGIHTVCNHLGLRTIINFQESEMVVTVKDIRELYQLTNTISLDEIVLQAMVIRKIYEILKMQGVELFGHDCFCGRDTVEYSPKGIVENIDILRECWSAVTLKFFGVENGVVCLDSVEAKTLREKNQLSSLISFVKYPKGQFSIKLNLQGIFDPARLEKLKSHMGSSEIYIYIAKYYASKCVDPNGKKIKNKLDKLADQFRKGIFHDHVIDSEDHVHALLSSGFWSVDDCFSTGLPLLYEAIRKGDDEIVNVLFKHYKPSPVKTDIFWFAIEECPKEKMSDVMRFLFKAFQNKSIRLMNGNTQQHIEALFGQIDSSNISNITLENDFGVTPAYFFLVGYSMKCHFLVNNSFEVEVVLEKIIHLCKKIKTPMSLFLRKAPTVGVLKNLNATCIAAIHSHISLFEKLMSFEYLLTENGEMTYMLMFIAASKNAVEVLEWMKKKRLLPLDGNKASEEKNLENALNLMRTMLSNGSYATLDFFLIGILFRECRRQ